MCWLVGLRSRGFWSWRCDGRLSDGKTMLVDEYGILVYSFVSQVSMGKIRQSGERETNGND